MKTDRAQADELVERWDKVMERNPEGAQGDSVLPIDQDNHYIKSKAVKDQGVERSSSDDENLITAYALLNARGFDHPLAQMMSTYAEESLPHTITRLFRALDSTRQSDKVSAQELKEQIRGMVMITYAWAYCMKRTGALALRDQSIYQEMLAVADAKPSTIERQRLTASAENKLEHTTGMLLQAINQAYNKGETNVQLFFQGSLMMLYALANCHFGRSAGYVEPVTA